MGVYRTVYIPTASDRLLSFVFKAIFFLVLLKLFWPVLLIWLAIKIFA